VEEAGHVLRGLPAARVDRILIEIAAKRAVDVAIVLHSGARIEGRVLDVRREGVRGTVLLHTGERDDVIYVELAAIEAVLVKNASRHVSALSFGAIEDPPLEAAPAKFELDARAQAIAAAFGGRPALEIVWDGIEPTEAARRSLAALLEATASAIQQINQDTTGRAQLAQLTHVYFEHGAGASVIREGVVLRVISELEKGHQGRVDAIGLITAIAASG
jgi:hypothetical protein